MPGDRVPQPGEVWQWLLPPERFRERSRVRVYAVDVNGDSVAFEYLRSGELGGSTLLSFLRVYELVWPSDEAVSA